MNFQTRSSPSEFDCRQKHKKAAERRDANPSISTLWKISNEMKVPFDALTLRPKSQYEIVKTAELQPLLEDHGTVKNYSIFPDDETAVLHMILFNP